MCSSDLVVADDVPKKIFNKKEYKKKLIFWGIKDAPSKNKKKVEIVIKQIIKKVDGLVEQLEKVK